MPSMLGEKSADILKYFSYSSQKVDFGISWYFMQIVSLWSAWNANPFFSLGKNKENINLSSAESAQGVVKVSNQKFWLNGKQCRHW